MKIEKQILVDGMKGLYAVGRVSVGGKTYYTAASEDRGGAVYLVDAESKKTFRLYGGAGGVMAALDLADEDAVFCIEEFYPVFDSATAKIVKIVLKQSEEALNVAGRKILAEVPYVHRAAQLEEEDGVYLAAGTLCKHKENPDDWTTSGTMEIGRYEKKKDLVEFERVWDGVAKHHAMYVKKKASGYDDLYYGGTEGVFRTVRKDGKWKTEQLLNVPTSDIVYEDLDGDGKEELVIIEGFHGDKAAVFQEDGGEFKRALELPLDFGHVLWGGQFLGKPGLITGSRGGEKELILYRLQNDGGSITVSEKIVMDKGQAPAQIIVDEADGGASVVAANHGVAQLTEYRCCE